ncbi:hypothetical protein [Aureibacter tunicatorum]|uniref:Uncharacterized protein n=1 Tax=Aureibacter tunicatorum TaxID=866807 RepID=A0AAE4BRD2_9BACT|nr:hypothetical protein [Aureibacter tunicatorum]MDR6238541.1 hypothetical protein [Aureibacter tunicatorum]BDD05528.1 hypothetical protein AUTU_30110 [Aureibacter tunicatorum]
MKNKISLTFIFLFTALWLGSNYYFISLKPEFADQYTAISLPIALIFFGLLLFNFAIRKNLKFESYFKSPFNILTLAFYKNYQIDLPKDLLYIKMDEVLRTNGFELVEKDEQKQKLLAITKFNFLSWGENLYVKINEQNGNTEIEFCSASVFSITWGRNKRNFDKLVKGLDNALII